MPRISVNDDLSLIECILTGNINTAAFSQATYQIVDLVEANQIYNVLFDCSKLTHGLDVYDILSFTTILRIKKAPKVRFAVLINEHQEFQKKFVFWSNCCFSKGIPVKLFDNKRDIIEHLI